MSALVNAITCKCPNCKKGEMFEEKGTIFLLRPPKMHVRCEVCNYKFEKEPGFYIGAMYVSYALGVGEIVACLVVLWGICDFPVSVIISVLVSLIVLTSFVKYRLSRSIWSYLFYRG